MGQIKTRIVVFKMLGTPLSPCKKEDDPERWFRDRGIRIVTIQGSLSPPDAEIVFILPEQWLLATLDKRRTDWQWEGDPSQIMVVSNHKEFLRGLSARGFELHPVETNARPMLESVRNYPPTMDAVLSHIQLLNQHYSTGTVTIKNPLEPQK